MAPMQMDKSSCKHDGSQQNQLNGHIGNGGNNHDQDRKPADAAGGHARGRDMNGAVGCGKRPVCDEPSFYTAGNNFKDSETGTFNKKGKSAEGRHKDGSRVEGCNKIDSRQFSLDAHKLVVCHVVLGMKLMTTGVLSSYVCLRWILVLPCATEVLAFLFFFVVPL
ncbi:hypothetical protein Ancab_015438 [Ancistrocladus abbreviatus]